MGFKYIYLTTNGALADKDRMRILCKNGLSSVKFSFDAATVETYKMIHGRDDFQKVRQNFFDTIELKKEGYNLGVFCSYAVLKSNQSEVELFKETIAKYADDVTIGNAFEQGGDTPELIDELIDKDARLGSMPCPMIFNTIHVTYEGYLTACCVDTENMLVYADLNEVSLKEAWHNEIITQLRAEHLSNLLGNNRCYNCINKIPKKDIEPLMRFL